MSDGCLTALSQCQPGCSLTWAAEGSKLDFPLSCFEKKMRNVNLQARFCKKEDGIVFRGVSWRFWWCQAAAVGLGSLPLKSPSAISDSCLIAHCSKYTIQNLQIHTLNGCCHLQLTTPQQPCCPQTSVVYTFTEVSQSQCRP